MVNEPTKARLQVSLSIMQIRISDFSLFLLTADGRALNLLGIKKYSLSEKAMHFIAGTHTTDIKSLRCKAGVVNGPTNSATIAQGILMFCSKSLLIYFLRFRKVGTLNHNLR